MNSNFENETIQNTIQDTMQNTAIEPEKAPKAPKEKRRTGWRAAVFVLCCALIGGASGVGGSFFGNYLLNRGNARRTSNVLEGRRETSVIDVAQVDTGREMTAAEVYAANVNATVGITTSITTNYWGFPTSAAASGSGFIITEDGYILTNYHVIKDADAITVALYDGKTYDAALIGYDESNDIAVLKVEAEEPLTPVVFGDSDNLRVGDSVLAIGNPLGELTFSLTSGAVSALDREVTLSYNVTMDLIQTDCAINSGNSGGALFNLYGEVVGITNAKYSASGAAASIDNIGFAIPVNDIRPIVESIIEKGYITKPYIGVSVTNTSAEAQRYGIPLGAAVMEVSPESPAEKAGLQKNDIITKVNDTTISESRDLVNIIGKSAIGEELKLSVYRQGESMEVTIKVGEQKKAALANEAAEQNIRQQSR